MSRSGVNRRLSGESNRQQRAVNTMTEILRMRCHQKASKLHEFSATHVREEQKPTNLRSATISPSPKDFKNLTPSRTRSFEKHLKQTAKFERTTILLRICRREHKNVDRRLFVCFLLSFFGRRAFPFAGRSQASGPEISQRSNFHRSTDNKLVFIFLLYLV